MSAAGSTRDKALLEPRHSALVEREVGDGRHGANMLYWHDEFCSGLVDQGFHVARFDNRDRGENRIGLSRAVVSGVL